MPTILIVDDEPITRMDIRDMVEDLGFTVLGEAADGFDAIELCRTHHPDVVLMDVKMPIFDGLTASETILAEDLSPCVVLLTAFSDREVIRRAQEAGVTGYLVKPVQPHALLPTIEVAREQAKRLRETRLRAEEAEEKLQNDRLIHKAQRLYAAQQGCTEAQAYQLLRKAAMDKRIPLATLCESVVLAGEKRSAVNRAKALLMERKHMTEDKAHRLLQNTARTRGITMDSAAEEILRRMKGED